MNISTYRSLYLASLPDSLTGLYTFISCYCVSRSCFVSKGFNMNIRALLSFIHNGMKFLTFVVVLNGVLCPVIRCFNIFFQSICEGFKLYHPANHFSSRMVKTISVCIRIVHLITSQQLAYFPTDFTYFADTPVPWLKTINSNWNCPGTSG